MSEREMERMSERWRERRERRERFQGCKTYSSNNPMMKVDEG